jgi:hypothetical protein
MKTRNTLAKVLSMIVLLAALAGFVVVGPVAADHCASPVPMPLSVREDSWARFYQYSLASWEEATPAEIATGKPALASRICLDGDSMTRFASYMEAQTQQPVRNEPDSWKRFELYLIGTGLK